MSRADHKQLMELFDDACDLDPEARAGFVDRVASEDAALGQKLAALLTHDRRDADTLDIFSRASGPLVFLSSHAESGSKHDQREWVAEVGPIPGIPDLEVVAPIAEGGMGRVLLARQHSLDRDVAVKVVRSETSSRLSEGLFGEARLAGSLEHPNIVPVHMLVQDAHGLPVLVMKRVEGVSLRTLVDDPDHSAWAPILANDEDRLSAYLSILRSVSHALHFAHSRGIVHLDVKPDNIMVGSFGEVYLVDWGVAARLPAMGDAFGSGQGRIVGTPGFMAPEMARNGSYDIRTDVYLLGATLHYLLTNSVRHAGRSSLEQLMTAVESRPVDYGVDVPEELAAICNAATHLDPAQRPATALAFRDAIVEHVRHRGAVQLSDTARERLTEARALRNKDSAAPGFARSMDELLTECQFAFHEALRAWPASIRAREGLRECLEAMIEHEIAQQHAARARALLEQLHQPPEALVQAVGDLETLVRARDELAQRHLEHERAQDWTVSEAGRTAFFLCVIICSLAITTWERAAPSAPMRHVHASVLNFFALLVLVWLFRRIIYASVVARRVVFGTLGVVGLVAVHRILGLFPAPPTATMISDDAFIAAAASTIGALIFVRRLWILAIIFLSGAFVTRLWTTGYHHEIFAVTAVLSCLVGIRLTSHRYQPSNTLNASHE